MFGSVSRNPAGVNEKVVDFLFMILVKTGGMQRARNLAATFLQVVTDEAGLVGDVEVGV